MLHSLLDANSLVYTVLESYITHIRVTEDAAYPSSPAAPNSPPENKKLRVVIVAVRKSGRVRMHKARENNDGSFSIGKTWVLDDLSAVQSFASMVPSNPLEQQQKQWAGDVGFIVTVGKPYYWQAATGKEKDFFIGSLVKIYKKYTGGKLPNLLGFSPRERELLTGTASPAPQGLQPSKNQIPSAAKSDTSLPRSKSPPASQRPQPPRTIRTPSQEGNRELRKPSSQDPFPRSQRSQEQMQRPPGLPTATRSRPPIPPTQSSQGPSSHQAQQTNERRDANGFLPPPSGPIEPMQSRLTGPSSESLPIQLPTKSSRSQLGSNESLPQGSKFPASDDKKGFSEADLRLTPEPAKSTSELRTDKQSFPEPKQEPTPEIARPVAQRPPGSFGQGSTRSESNEVFSTPLTVPEPSNAESRTSSRGSDRAPKLEPTASIPPLAIPSSLRPGSSLGEEDRTISPPSEPTRPFNEPVREPARLPAREPVREPVRELVREPVREPERGPEKGLEKEPTPSVSSRSFKADTAPTDEPPVSSPSTSQPETPATEEGEAEPHRPGLGPMVKKKVGGMDVANTFRKAATAYNAFKPRVGGAAERLMTAKEKEMKDKEPDGITGVVPAPLHRGMSNDSVNVPTPEASTKETTSLPEPSQEPPNVHVTVAPTRPKPQADGPSDDSRPKSPTSQAERRRKRREDNTAKYCNALNVDPSLLEGQGADFDEILTDLGWNGKLEEDKKIEDLEADIRREIGRVQASSWLGHLEQQEGKVDQLGKLFEKTIEECEELDGLLTLYSHELNVSFQSKEPLQLEINVLIIVIFRHWPMTSHISRLNLKVCRFKLRIRSSSRTSWGTS